MKVGFVSDTHDRLDVVEKIFKSFSDYGIKKVYHLGDIISPFVIPVIKRVYEGDVVFVYGNNDGEKLFLKKKVEEANWKIDKPPILDEVNGKKVVIMHEPLMVEALFDSGHFDIVAYGHTHEVVVKTKEGRVLLNPGEACGYLKGMATYAIVDLEKMAVIIKEVK